MSRSSGKKKTSSSGRLGRAIQKERNRERRSRHDDGWLHTSDLGDGMDWNKLNLRSVTEESQLDEFLRTAELAGLEFTAERLNVKVIDPSSSRSGIPSVEEEREIEKKHNKFKELIGIPRRPDWGPMTTPEQLELAERDSFLSWRRNLARLEEEEEGLIFTPFEKNLQFWRQLWRVIERSDVVVQIVDARNPLLFHCEDLAKYVTENEGGKVNLILVSKADLLSRQQRVLWSEYFSERGIAAAFWSAQLAEQGAVGGEREDKDEGLTLPSSSSLSSLSSVEKREERKKEEKELEERRKEEKEEAAACQEILSREELLKLFIDLSPVSPNDGVTTVGLVGYPNVGKSSTINVLYQEKKVPVSATPGRTKHFQTLHISDHLILCDCPGLVFPSLVSTKAEMVVSGILPIDQLRDHTPPVSLVCQRIPRSVLERVYGLKIPPPGEGEDPTRYPTAHELLSAYGYLHGYMTSHGLPDCPRSARYILKDYVKGKLLYCHPPPGVTPESFNPFLTEVKLHTDRTAVDTYHSETSNPPPSSSSTTTITISGDGEEEERTVELSEFDKHFLKQTEVRAITKSCHGIGKKSSSYRNSLDQEEGEGQREVGGASETDDNCYSDTASITTSSTVAGKPWKRHHNRNKKEKTRRTTTDYL